MTDDFKFQKDVESDYFNLKSWRAGNGNVFDPTAREGSIWQNRPAYLFQSEWKLVGKPLEKKPLPIIEAGSKKDWNAKPANSPPKKDWSKLGR